MGSMDWSYVVQIFSCFIFYVCSNIGILQSFTTNKHLNAPYEIQSMNIQKIYAWKRLNLRHLIQRGYVSDIAAHTYKCPSASKGILNDMQE